MSVQLIVITQCFEHWVLLHFVHDDSPCENCDCVVSKLRKITAYTKSSFQFDEAMRGLEDACQRAKTRRESIQSNLSQKIAPPVQRSIRSSKHYVRSREKNPDRLQAYFTPSAGLQKTVSLHSLLTSQRQERRFHPSGRHHRYSRRVWSTIASRLIAAPFSIETLMSPRFSPGLLNCTPVS